MSREVQKEDLFL